jgi:hypothetical protein
MQCNLLMKHRAKSAALCGIAVLFMRPPALSANVSFSVAPPRSLRASKPSLRRLRRVMFGRHRGEHLRAGKMLAGG